MGRDVTSGITKNLLVRVTVVSVVVRSFPQEKTNQLRLAKQSGHQASKIKTQSFEIFLSYSSPIFHYAVNVTARGQSGKFLKLQILWQKALEFTFLGLKTF